MLDRMKNREILLGVCGGIAAYKVADLVSKLVQSGAGVSVAMTAAATKFVGPTTFEALTGRPVHLDLFEPKEHPLGEHIGLARRAEIYVIAPATASIIADVSQGHAGDLVSTLALTVTCPVLVVPSMNNEMWAKPPVQRNVLQLRADGVAVMDPQEGWLSCGVIGAGRMAEPAAILGRIAQMFILDDDSAPPAE
jgi:phosphopantothenoylcysteine decarboxylase